VRRRADFSPHESRLLARRASDGLSLEFTLQRGESTLKRELQRDARPRWRVGLVFSTARNAIRVRLESLTYYLPRGSTGMGGPKTPNRVGS
jgi:hypothetical protein